MKTAELLPNPRIPVKVPRTKRCELHVKAKSGECFYFPCDQEGKASNLVGTQKASYDHFVANAGLYEEPVLVIRHVITAVQEAYDRPYST